MKWALLALALLVQPARAELTGVIVHLRAHGQRAAFLLDRDEPLIGLPVAREFLAAHFPGRTDLGGQRVLAVLRDPDFRARVQRILEVTGRRRVDVFLVLTDAPDRVYRGETLHVPLGGTGRTVPVAALEDRDLRALAARLGTTPQEVARHEPERFEVFPHMLVDDPPRGKSVFIGERGLAEACHHDLDVLRQMLLHEIAHCVDESPDPGDAGALDDLAHGPWTVLSPRRALAEGWGDYWAIQVPGLVREAVDQGPPPAMDALGRYAMLRCSPVVAGVLADVAALRPGPAALHAAVREAWRTRGAGVLEVLAAYRRRHPGYTQAIAEALARRTRGQGTPVDYLMLACGSPTAPPRPGSPSGEGPAAPPPPAGSGSPPPPAGDRTAPRR